MESSCPRGAFASVGPPADWDRDSHEFAYTSRRIDDRMAPVGSADEAAFAVTVVAAEQQPRVRKIAPAYFRTTPALRQGPRDGNR